MYASTNAENDKIVHLTGTLNHDLRYLQHPLPSDTNIIFTFTKAKDKQLLDHFIQYVDVNDSSSGLADNTSIPDVRICLTYFELYILRKVFDVSIHEKIMDALKQNIDGEKRLLKYFYNRVQVFSELVPGNSRSFTR